MPVHVNDRQLEPGMKVVSLSGRIDMEAAEADYPMVRQAIEACPAGIIVDLRDVEFISSSGFRMLLAAYRDAQGAGKTLLLTRPRPSVYKIFKVAALDTVLPFCDEREVEPIDATCK